MTWAEGKQCVVRAVDWEVDVDLAQLYVECGLTSSAELRYAAAADRAGRAGIGRPSRAAILQRLALVKQNRGDRAGAVPLLDDALALVREGSDVDSVRVRAGVHATRGQVARALGDLRTAGGEAERAAELFAQIGDVDDEARALVDLAVVLKDTDRIAPARTVARLALALARSAGADDVAGHAMVVLGLVYELLGKRRPALRSQSIALRLLAGCGQYGAAAVAAHNAAAVELNEGHHAAARRFYEAARVLNRRAGWPIGEANDLSGLASVAKAVGDHEHARALHAEALPILVECGDVPAAVQSLADLAELAEDDATALAHLAQAEALAVQTGELRLVELVGVVLGDVHRARGRFSSAEAAYARAAEAAEAPRAWLFDEADALAYFGNSRLAAREHLARLALDHHDPSVAFERVEQARASEMVRRLSRLRVPATHRVPADLVDAEASALRELRLAAAAFTGPDAADPESARRYASAEARWQEAVDAIAEHDEQFSALRRGDRSTVARIRATLRAHDPDALLVVMHGTETAIHLLGLTATDEIPWHAKVPCDTDEVIDVVERVVTACSTDDLAAVAEGVTDPLLTAMLEPVARRSRPGQQICLVPHGALHRLPFAAVHVDGRPFGERNPLVSTPSASVLGYCLAGRRGTTGDALVVTEPAAGPPLRYARAQTHAIARHFPTEELTGDHAARAAVLARLAPGGPVPRLLHLTAHGRFIASRPMSSGIRLTDGDLTAEDLLGVSLAGALAVLCACRTGVSAVGGGGDEQLGLVRALLYAGASAVLVGLWKVSQLAAGILFDRFYRELAAGTASAVALQRAQTELRNCTATRAAEYIRSVHAYRDDSHLRIEEARYRLRAGQFRAVVDLCDLALGDPELTAAQRRSVTGLRDQSLVSAQDGVAGTPDPRVFANPYYWAPFALVGDWR
ncbi:CHAT domain-containing protein [Amycolatopsis sp. Hca4]|uniref:CHAT domain-containing protein n=1 Tax=Amycolatopsis sp. Hca4 TaxID=2742131 RepID=UPI001591C83F|nr:CHAT domain-containing protein [Amycolatopsis sp. Hca4]QKV80640.1 CHAT domain-containing protein [Amycolatopsis sp. Hca4]